MSLVSAAVVVVVVFELHASAQVVLLVQVALSVQVVALVEVGLKKVVLLVRPIRVDAIFVLDVGAAATAQLVRLSPY